MYGLRKGNPPLLYKKIATIVNIKKKFFNINILMQFYISLINKEKHYIHLNKISFLVILFRVFRKKFLCLST